MATPERFGKMSKLRLAISPSVDPCGESQVVLAMEVEDVVGDESSKVA